MMKLRINPLVAQDLKSIKDYIAEDNADKALETILLLLIFSDFKLLWLPVTELTDIMT